MSPRRDHIPPYEIMGRPSGESPKAPVPPIKTSRPAVADWMQSWQEPVILRVPRGLALLILLGVLGLIVLAYAVGHSRGDAAGVARLEQQWKDESAWSRPRLPPRVAGGATSASSSDAPKALGEGVGVAPKDDFRTPGQNYFVLAHYPDQRAQALAAFLETYGVEIALVSGHNTRLAKVVALRGFSREALTSEERRDYESRLRRLGREWKAANDGKGKDLSDLYLERYEGD